VNGLLCQFYDFTYRYLNYFNSSRITEATGPKFVSEITSIFVIESSRRRGHEFT
jgi:hypothetical protein